MVRPVPRVYLGFGSTWQTEPGEIDWTEVTDQVMDRRTPVSCERGARSAVGEPTGGQLSLAFRNNDRRFDRQHPASPYAGNLLPGTPIKIDFSVLDSLVWDGDPLTWDESFLVFEVAAGPVWRGHATGFPQRYDRGNQAAWVDFTAYDPIDKLSRAKVPQATYPLEVLADSPIAYWRLDESEGNVMLDLSGNSLNGLYDNANLGQDPLIIDGTGHAAQFDHVGDNRGQFKGGGLPVAAPVTLEAWVKLDRELTEQHNILTVQRDNAYGSSLELVVETSVDGSPNGELVVNFRGLGGFLKARGHTRVDDGEAHHIVLTMASNAAADIKLYVDAVEQTKTVLFGTTGGSWTSHLMWVVGNVAASSAFDFGIGGVVDEVAVYASALSSAQVLAHYEAGAFALTGQRTDERIGYILDAIGWPAGMRQLEEGRTFLGTASFQAGDKAFDYLRKIASTEGGLLFIAADGALTFHDRYWPWLATEATVVQFTFSDQPGEPGVREFQIDDNDDLLVNTARFTRRGGAEQVATDEISRELHGEAEVVESDLLHNTDAEVRSRAQWAVATGGNPQPRLPVLRVALHNQTADDQALILGLDIGHRIQAVKTPQGVGDPIDLELAVAGVKHTISAVEWWIDFYVAPAPDVTQELFILGTSELGGTDILAY